MRQTIRMIIGVLLVTMVVTGTAFAWGSGCDKDGKGDRDHKDRMAEMAKELNLTADQEAQLKATKEAHRTQMESTRLALKEKRQALKGELAKAGVTREAVEPIVAEIKTLEGSLTEQRVDGIFKVKEILTADQFAKLQAKKEAKSKEGRGRHGRKGR